MYANNFHYMSGDYIETRKSILSAYQAKVYLFLINFQFEQNKLILIFASKSQEILITYEEVFLQVNGC